MKRVALATHLLIYFPTRNISHANTFAFSVETTGHRENTKVSTLKYRFNKKGKAKGVEVFFYPFSF
ncbi:Hypothetical protein CpMEX30_0290 [Corynebacterium pseudotuberculosis]|uniref:Uncharacterized protein n=2 Tax=Corynebacterium pseudotuberculosis TaxID=1719 RepID=D9QE39_CORP2|nr:hypothetical protein CPC231_01360 [Corynebacterium pseudotuberculosis C231]ADL20168.1 hypothetical protein CP1002_01360 [Corynebacterium pseudotuberculosis 1002]ADO25557.2 hypothetical protein CPI19_01360 [Corynebacterium pseudotuberculosis I19]AEK91605.1 Hypothetical protein CpPAT10_0270 [Corynebacterium pseudotuberculosis PAT10]AEQ05829.2 hypothetical protein CPCIP5297_01420 [Corynebacterium pseudotuberculosis CIP 52.97]AER68365.1 Hypothetical protein Cp106_0258 [Corynebacterium pseudotub